MAPCYSIVYGPTADAADPILDLNNVVIPPVGKPRLTIEPVYGDDGVQVAYYEHTVVIDTIIYSQTLTSGVADVETDVERIRKILSTPSLRLKISPIGIGTYPVINGTSGKPDVKGGPYPQKVIVEPIGGINAIAVHWEVMFRINFCSDNLADLVQFNSELDIDVDDEGDVTFNFRATYQRRTPFTNIGVVSNLMDVLQRNTGAAFHGMKRRKRSSLSRDQRTLHVHIEYKDIKSDSPYAPYIRNCEVIDEVSSDLLSKSALHGQGFMTWARRLSGSITLPPRIHKSYAWLIFLRIIEQRFSRLNHLSKLASLLDATGVAGLPANDKNSYLLLSIKISNSVYTRGIKFDLGYIVITDLENLIPHTKVLARANSVFSDEPDRQNPLPLSDQWLVWDASTNVNIAGALGYTFGGPIVYNQCTGVTTSPRLAATSVGALETDPDVPTPQNSEYPERPDDARYSWMDYSNEFYIEEETNNVHNKFIQPVNSNYYKTTEADANSYGNREAVGLRVNGRISDPDSTTEKPVTINRGPSTFKIRMVGYAIRLKHKIPIPSIVSYNGLAVSRTGTPDIRHRQISKGNPPVYMAMWNIVYTVDGDIHADDIMSKIKTNGVPGHFF